MKVLYAIQGTGNGHLCRAMELVPLFERRVQVDVLVSGTQVDLKLPFRVAHRTQGLSFIFGKNGGVDHWGTLRSMIRGRVMREVRELPVEDYDLVINDFEPISAWAARIRGVPCFALSHQAALLDPSSPVPAKSDGYGPVILRHYAPARMHFGFHFREYGQATFKPIIREKVRYEEAHDHGHYTVYLPAYDDEHLLHVLNQCGKVHWQVFSKHSGHTYTKGNILISPIQDDAFVWSMANSSGVLCGAGFEAPAEALFLGKKLMVIPMNGQYEQQCNAAALERMGVPVLDGSLAGSLELIRDWVDRDERVHVDYPDESMRVVDTVLSAYCAMLSAGTVTDPDQLGGADMVRA